MEEPSESIPSPPEPPPRRIPPLATPLQVGVSWACLALLIVFLLAVAAFVHLTPPEGKMLKPGEYLHYSTTRALEAEDALRASGGLMGAYHAIGTTLTGETMPAAAKALEEWTTSRPGDGPALELLAVIQLERGKTERGTHVLGRLAGVGHEDRARRIAEAYGVTPDYPEEVVRRFDTGTELQSTWAENVVAHRAAEARGDGSSAATHQQRRVDAGTQGAWTLTLMDGGTLVLSILGLPFVALYLFLRPDLTVAAGHSRPPWTAAEGFGVIARGALVGLVVGQCCCMSFAMLLPPAFLAGALMMGIPAVLFGWFYLHRPYRIGFLELFGMGHVRWGKMLLVTFACLCFTFTLQTVVGLSAQALGLGPHWAESGLEQIAIGTWLEALSASAAVAVGAPIGEELLFRAYFYSALRTKFSPAWSIVISAAVFGAIHPYSIAGLIAVGTSGAVWAFAYEKTRSLWPPILCHGLMNLSVAVLQLGVYR